MSTYTGTKTNFYVADEDTAEFVNLAMALSRPILVEGEPGCGKTRLADSIADELGLGEPVKISVRSTSRAKDLLYRFDAIRRLQDAQNPRSNQAQHIYPYLSLGALGAALHERKQRVVLIDEIDKADIDFPNDLLDVLEELSFEIEDLPPKEERQCLKANKFGRRITASSEAKPIVVITSNREKPLPEPFLRRCIYIHLEFPKSSATLADIVEKNLRRAAVTADKDLIESAVKAFLEIRKTSGEGTVQKLPTTSELIDWVRILHLRSINAKTLEPVFPDKWKTLFKSIRDIQAYEARAQAKMAQAAGKGEVVRA